MFTAAERRALVFLALVAALGGVVRVVRPRPVPFDPPVAPNLPGEDLMRQAALVRRAQELARPLAPGERVDVDRASAAELERLPRVGPALARRIVLDRDSSGPFGSLPALARVPGVGPSLLREVAHAVTFSGTPRAEASGLPASSRPALDGWGPAPPCDAPGRLSLSLATAEELACLPGIGPVLAERIVAYRARHGPFRRLRELERVPGIGPQRMRRLAERVLP